MIVPAFVSPSAAAFPIVSVPSWINVTPLKLLEVASTREPGPSLVRVVLPLSRPLPVNVKLDVLLTVRLEGSSDPVRFTAGAAEPVSNRTVSPWKNASERPPRNQFVAAATSHTFALPSPVQMSDSGAPEACTRISPTTESSKTYVNRRPVFAAIKLAALPVRVPP